MRKNPLAMATLCLIAVIVLIVTPVSAESPEASVAFEDGVRGT